MRAAYGKNTRELLAGKVRPRIIIDFCDLPIFDATTYPAILLVEKERPTGRESALAATFTDAGQLDNLEETLATLGFLMPVKALKSEGWTLERSDILNLMAKLRAAGIPLGEYVKGKFYYGIKTGLNEAFVIDGETRERLIAEDPKSAGLIKPWLRGRDIKEWKAEWAGLYLIAIASSSNKAWPWSKQKSESTARALFAKTYPAIHNHLSQWEDRLRKRDDQGQFWWELRSCVYWAEFGRPKIIVPAITNDVQYAIDYAGRFSNDKTSICVTEDPEFAAALLNSKVLWWVIRNQAATRSGGFYEFKPMYVTKLPIPPASNAQKAAITNLVRRILASPDGSDVPRLEAEIDRLVYGLYGLTPDEIALVEVGHEST